MAASSSAHQRLFGRTAVITGAAQGIGATSAELFARHGAQVVLIDIADDPALALQRRINDSGGSAIFVHADITNEQSVKSAVDRALEHYGKIDILFNVAGGSSTDDQVVHQVDMRLWEPTMSVNLLGTFLMCRHVLPAMIKAQSGSIINTSSWAALTGFHKHIYVSAKGGLLSLTSSMAGEYARAGIRVNVICPGGVRSERNKSRYEAANVSPLLNQRRNEIAKRYPFSYGDPIDIANIGLFLASDESRMITGATIPADGGRSAY